MGIGYEGSRTPHWGTPQELFDSLVEEFGEFDLDPCALNADVAKCKNFYDEKQDGLTQDWNGRVFINPPYGRAIKEWMEKLARELLNGNTTFAVALLPMRSDTQWFFDIIQYATELRLMKGRVKFVDYNNSCEPSSSTFPSCLMVFDGWGLNRLPRPVINTNLKMCDNKTGRVIHD